jgi:hypothetical protein
MYGMSAITAVINPPQAAILGVGALREVLARVDGEIIGPHANDPASELRPQNPLRRGRGDLPRADP